MKRNARILVGAMVATFVVLRTALWFSPNADFGIGGYNIHHLFTGLVLITGGGVPLAVIRESSRRLDVALAVFGIGLAMALDEVVYLIATDGSNESYLLPVSFWGGAIAVTLAVGYTVVVTVVRHGRTK